MATGLIGGSGVMTFSNFPSPHDEHLIDGEQLRYRFVEYKL
jgi:hypothetical protein